MKTRSFQVLAVLFISILVFAGSIQAQEDTLVFSSRLWSQTAEQEFIRDHILEPFEEEHDVNVEFEVIADEELLDRAYVQQEADEVRTDVVVVLDADMPEWIENDFIIDMTTIVEEWDDRTFMDTFEHVTHSNGQQYFVPGLADVYLTVANNQALDYLPEGVDPQDLTWEDFANWSNAIADGEGIGRTVVAGDMRSMFTYQFGAMALSYGAGFPEIDTPGAVEAWELLAQMSEDFIPEVLLIDYEVEPMLRQEAFLGWMHSARAGEVYSDAPAQYTLGPVPAGPEGRGTIAGMNGFAVVKGAPNEELAIKFIEYMSDPEVMVEVAGGTGGFIPAVEESLDYLGDDPEDIVMQEALAVLEEGVVSGIPAEDFEDWRAVQEVFDNVFRDMILDQGEVSLDRLEDAAQEMDDLRM